jgi:formylglycine-generating enzyme required for sulfatase activity
MLKPTGFWSYSSTDDESSQGRLSQLRELLRSQLQLRIGRNPKVHIFQDVAAIPPGTDWERQIDDALKSSSFLIAIVTPALLQSEWCSREIMLFREKEAELGRNDLIFPLHYIDVNDLDPGSNEDCHDVKVYSLLRSRQWIDFKQLTDAASPSANEDVLKTLGRMAVAIRGALRRAEPHASPATAQPSPEPPPPRPPLAGSTHIHDFPEAPTLVRVPAGRFLMGSASSEFGRDDDEGPRHEVEIEREFAIGIFPVTFSQWALAQVEGGVDYAPDDRNWGHGNQPVINVSSEDAQKYCAWLGKRTGKKYRLPTEAEWEYAARAGTTTPFWWGDRISPEQANYNGQHPYGDGPKGQYRKHPVPVNFQQFEANPWGLYQVHGNIWEWCEDNWFADYNDAPRNGAARYAPEPQITNKQQMAASRPKFLQRFSTGRSSDDPRAPVRVVRGGSWRLLPEDLRSARRMGYRQNYRGDTIGFRVARDL